MMYLGPFVLQQRIGLGGMGEVWRGLHQEQREPVAIKVLTQLEAHSGYSLASSRAAFRDEVRAVASLSHPSIIEVLDYGEIPAGMPEESFKEGSPFLVMELAQGSLNDWRKKLSWPPLRRILLSLLDALAHAHARGMIHRDIKPANVLLSPKWSQIKLADFGLVYGVEERPSPRSGPAPGSGSPSRSGATQEITGTLAYMAPEQFDNLPHLYGPWTDLYAVGCLVYALLMGQPPFGTRGTLMEMMFQHQCEPLPPLQAEIPLPPGFDDWLGRMLEKQPARRFQRAADAAWALLELEGLSEDELSRGDELQVLFGKGRQPGQKEAPMPTLRTLLHTRKHAGAEGEATVVSAEDLDATLLAGPAFLDLDAPQDLLPVELPPFPLDWRRPRSRARTSHLTGVGLGLYGVRTIPLVDREEVRDRLWEALHQVRSQRQLQLVLLEGPAGYGKSRLAEWLLHRAHEVGTAHALKALHSPMAGPAGGLEPMLARFLRCHGMDRRELREHLPGLLYPYGLRDPDERQVWMALLSQDPDAPGYVEDAKERYILLQRMLRFFSQSRPLLVWLDDVHWGLDSLSFVSHLLEAKWAHPALFLMTVRQEALVERPQEAALLEQLRAHPKTQRIEIGPLEEEDWPVLVRELLGLEGDVAARVEERTAGNPLFAVQLVGDWVQRGLLELGSKGFQLRPGVKMSLPDNVHSVWARRIERILSHRSQAEREALELAAVLAQDVDGAEWREACRIQRLPVPSGLIEALLESRLARCESHSPAISWSFVHGMLRESLMRQAQEAGRWAMCNRSCAEMLMRREGRGALVQERIARHLLAAGAREEALAPMHQAIRGRIKSGESRAASALLQEWEHALEQLQLPETSTYWGERDILDTWIALHEGRFDEARLWLDQAERGARAHQWMELLTEALMLRSKLAWNEGHSEGSFSPLAEAEVIARGLSNQRLLAEVHQSLGKLLCAQGRLDEAVPWLRRARDEYIALQDVYGIGTSYRNLANISRQSGDLEEAARLTDLAKAQFVACHSREDIADSLNLQGEIARLQGDLEAAEAHYRASLKRFRALESSAGDICELNLGMTLILLHRYTEARIMLEECLRSFQKHGRSLFQGMAHVCLLPCIVDAEDWGKWDHHLLSGSTILSKAHLHDVDAAGSAELAGRLAMDKGQHYVARGAFTFALSQWRALQRSEDIARVQALLQAIPA